MPIFNFEQPTNVIDDTMTFKPEAIKALREFKKAKTFRETVEVRLGQMRELIGKLCEVYGMPPVSVAFPEANDTGGGSGSSYYDSHGRCIVMKGHLSIITLLHEFKHARDLDTRGTIDQKSAQKFAVNLFRKVYPRQFARLAEANGESSYMFLATGHTVPVELSESEVEEEEI